MAFVSTSPSASSPTNSNGHYAASPQQSTPLPVMPHQHHQSHRQRHISRHQWTQSLSRDLHNFVIQLLPTNEEMAVKEDVRKLLERLIRTIEPESRLLSFGSTANGFSLRNSDMDLCCLIDSGQPPLSASDLVTMVGDLLERETKFKVKTLPHARIPIVKLSLDPSPGLPYGISCDIGFENRLALENTRLLMSYASIDPVRVRTLVIFLKVWSKRRKINSPYLGTLSSYGYALLVIFFLVHVKNPPVLPNLQQLPPPRAVPYEDTHINGHDVWFFDDIALLKERWQSENTDSVGELLIDFFKYYSRDFTYNTGVASIKNGLLKKSAKGWLSEYKDGRDERNRFCIEDPFETDFNVARCVTKEGLYTIRGEFMRAARILAARPERTILALSQLCEEREEEVVVRPPPQQPFIPPPRLASIPSQQPYTINSSALRPSGALPEFFTPASSVPISSKIPELTGEKAGSSSRPHSPAGEEHARLPTTVADPPEHMAPKRSKYTSPPPPDDPEHKSYENRLGLGITLATSSTTARQPVKAEEASSSSSEILSDEERAEVESVGSMDGISVGSGVQRMSMSQELKRPLSFFATTMPAEDEPGWLVINTPKANNHEQLSRGRTPMRFGLVGEQSATPTPTLKSHSRMPTVEGVPIPDSPSSRRSMSGPPGSAPRWIPYSYGGSVAGLAPRRTGVEEDVEEESVGSASGNGSGNGGYPGGSYPPAGQGMQFGSVRTPFPLYQQHQAVPHMHPGYITTAPSQAFTVHHPGPIVAPPPISIPMEFGRHSWHQSMGMYGSPASSAASSPVSTRRAKLPVNAPHGVKAQSLSHSPSSPGSGAVSPMSKKGSPSGQFVSPGSQSQGQSPSPSLQEASPASLNARSPRTREKEAAGRQEAAVSPKEEEEPLSRSLGSLRLGSSSASISSSSPSPIQSPR